MATGTPLGGICMKKDEPLPSIPGRECRSGISTPVTHYVVGEVKFRPSYSRVAIARRRATERRMAQSAGAAGSRQ
jgi:hypothetical protein